MLANSGLTHRIPGPFACSVSIESKSGLLCRSAATASPREARCLALHKDRSENHARSQRRLPADPQEVSSQVDHQRSYWQSKAPAPPTACKLTRYGRTINNKISVGGRSPPSGQWRPGREIESERLLQGACFSEYPLGPCTLGERELISPIVLVLRETVLVLVLEGMARKQRSSTSTAMLSTSRSTSRSTRWCAGGVVGGPNRSNAIS
jgi:hypothetical protein